ncbi:MAG: hypothetical protein WBH03_07875 [Cyclobacteriaceae bacterium]
MIKNAVKLPPKGWTLRYRNQKQKKEDAQEVQRETHENGQAGKGHKSRSVDSRNNSYRWQR